MKKLLLLLVLATMIASMAKSQTSVYFPFPESGIVWRQEGYLPGFNCCCQGNGPCLMEDEFEYYLGGDTLIGAYTYKKIYRTGSGVEHIIGQYTCPPWCSNDHYYYYSNKYSGGLRQDTSQHQIFYIDSITAQESLLYDFNLNVGDTIPGWATNYFTQNYVSAIDSVLIGNNYHKQFWLSCQDDTNYIALIEGIGSSYGLLSPLFTNLNVSLTYNMLLCVTIDSVTVYPDSSAICDYVTSVNTVDSKPSFSIYPNPFSDKLNIKLNSSTESEILLYDIASRKILQQKFTGAVSLNTKKLAKGVYVYEVRNKNGLIMNGKVVKN